MSPLVSLLKDQGLIEARAVHQNASFAAGVQFARSEGILPAPESNHAIRVAIDEALRLPRRGGSRGSSGSTCAGHGHFDLSAYDKYLAGSLEDFEYPAEAVAAALRDLPLADAAARWAARCPARPSAGAGGRGVRWGHAPPRLLEMRTPDLRHLAAGVALLR